MDRTFCGWCGEPPAGNHKECTAALTALADSLVVEAMAGQVQALATHDAARQARRAAVRIHAA